MTSRLALLLLPFALSACVPAEDPAEPVAPSIPLKSKAGADLCLLPAGTFRMGSTSGQDDEQPRHAVEISAFVIDKFEVMQASLAALAIPNPSQFKGDRRPVEMFRWSDAAEYCNERSRNEGLDPCYDEDTFVCDFSKNGYRLPTEAEWEYACTVAGTEPPIEGGGDQVLQPIACYAANSGKATAEAGSRRANAWGLHDMLGNVSEWCHDRYAKDYYAKSETKDPRGPAEGKHRVLRGGNWSSPGEVCRATRRSHDEPGTTDACFARNIYGFRCVRRPTDEELAKLKMQ
ncbi:MAG: SUMF1/EgtB/PvdO family nonheme iron enzyme [Planctomycetota bacterium]